MKQQLRERGPEGFLIFKVLSIFYFKSNPVGIYLLKVNNRTARIKCEICSMLTIKIPEQRLLTLKIPHTLF